MANSVRNRERRARKLSQVACVRSFVLVRSNHEIQPLTADPADLPGGVKGVCEGCHLVQDATESPYIRLVVVGLVVEELRGHVIRRANPRAGKIHRPL